MTGDASLRQRPMRRVIDPLTACGARFRARARRTVMHATQVRGPTEALPLELSRRCRCWSAQVKSALPAEWAERAG